MKFLRSPKTDLLLITLSVGLLMLFFGCGRSIEESKNEKSTTPVSGAVHKDSLKSQKLLYDAIITNDKGLLQQALEDNENLDFFFENGHTPLTLSILLADNSFTDEILKSGASTNLQNKSGQTPLHIAIFVKDIYILKNLLDKGADPNKHEVDQQSALMYAVTKDEETMAIELIINGANINSVANQEIYSQSKVQKHIDSLKLLESINTFQDENESTIKKIQEDAPLNFIRYKLVNSQSYENKLTQLENLKFIIDLKDKKRSKEIMAMAIDLNTGLINQLSANLYIETIYKNNDEVFKLLKEYNINPLSENQNGLTPLDIAAQELNIKFIELLKESFKYFLSDHKNDPMIEDILKDSCRFLPEEDRNMTRSRRHYHSRRRPRPSYTKIKAITLLNCDN